MVWRWWLCPISTAPFLWAMASFHKVSKGCVFVSGNFQPGFQIWSSFGLPFPSPGSQPWNRGFSNLVFPSVSPSLPRIEAPRRSGPGSLRIDARLHFAEPGAGELVLPGAWEPGLAGAWSWRAVRGTGWLFCFFFFSFFFCSVLSSSDQRKVWAGCVFFGLLFFFSGPRELGWT